MLLGKFTPIFYSRIVIYSSHLNEQKKTHQKILIFHEVMPCQSLPIFQLIWNASKIFPRYMTSLEPNVRNYAYISILFQCICFKNVRIPFPIWKVKILFLKVNWPLSPKKLVSLSENEHNFLYDVINKEFGQIWVNSQNF